jgi:hypothetical protein
MHVSMHRFVIGANMPCHALYGTGCRVRMQPGQETILKPEQITCPATCYEVPWWIVPSPVTVHKCQIKTH